MSKTIQLQKLQSAKRLTLRLKEAKQSLKPPNVDDENLSDSVATMADQFFSEWR